METANLNINDKPINNTTGDLSDNSSENADNDLNALKIYELKPIARKYNVKVSGKKSDIINRIKNVMQLFDNATIIQKYIRRYMIRKVFSLRSPAIFNRSICVNVSDPITMEPLNEIHPLLFMGIREHTDNQSNIFGFNIKSLIDIIKRGRLNIKNPFNRNRIDFQTCKDIITAMNHTIRLNPSLLKADDDENNPLPNANSSTVATSSFYNSLGVSPLYYRPKPYVAAHTRCALYLSLCNRRIVDLDTRVQAIFNEFDRLGNYTQASWFSNLTSHCYPRFYRCLFSIWDNRAQLSQHTKRSICNFFDPFYERVFNNRFHILRNQAIDNVRTLNKVKLMCVTVMEALIFSSNDEEYSKLGALYCLTALTTVSQSARIALPWLFESISS